MKIKRKRQDNNPAKVMEEKFKGLKVWRGVPGCTFEKSKVTMPKDLHFYQDGKITPFSATLVNGRTTKEFFAKDGTKLTVVFP